MDLLDLRSVTCFIEGGYYGEVCRLLLCDDEVIRRLNEIDKRLDYITEKITDVETNQKELKAEIDLWELRLMEK